MLPGALSCTTSIAAIRDFGRQDLPPARIVRSVPNLSFQLLERPWPALLQQAGERTIRKDLAAGLAARAVVRLVLGEDDALHRRAANRAGLAEAAVHRHAFAK